MNLGNLIGSYQSEAIPLWASIAIRIGWLRKKYARHNVSELKVYEKGIVLCQRQGEQKRELPLGEIRRIWFETFQSGNDQEGRESFRIDIIAQNLDVLFSLTRTNSLPDDQVFMLMKELHERWHKAMWRHYHVVAAIISLQSQLSAQTPALPQFLCMQKPDTRFAYTSRHWEFPGGKVEPGESEQEALKRELQEEMEYEVSIDEHLVTVEHEYPDFGITLSCWLCTAETDKFTRKEHIDHRWLTIDEMQELEWCEADAPVLDAIRKKITQQPPTCHPDR